MPEQSLTTPAHAASPRSSRPARTNPQALALAPGDPTTCDLLRLALDDVATQVSSQRLPFPGLPPRTLQSIDAQVAALEEEVLAGRELPAERDGEGEGEGEGELSRVREEEEGEEGESEVMRSGAVSRSEDGIEVSMEEEEEEEDEDGGSEGETMDMTGE